MIKLTFAERYQQARTYAAQVRVRKAMGAKYEHFKPAPSLKTAAMPVLTRSIFRSTIG